MMTEDIGAGARRPGTARSSAQVSIERINQALQRGRARTCRSERTRRPGRRTTASVTLAVSALAAGPVIPATTARLDSASRRTTVFCWHWFTDRLELGKYNSKPRLIEHIQLTLIALVVGFVISFVLALLAYRAQWLAAPITFIASLLYTIPSLADVLHPGPDHRDQLVHGRDRADVLHVADPVHEHAGRAQRRSRPTFATRRPASG